MKKIAFFREKRFENNNFYNTDIDKNLSPFKALVDINEKENTISSDQLDWRNDKNEFTILCRNTLSYFSFFDYIKFLIKYRRNKKYHIILEPYVVAPLWYNRLFHLFFDKIFTRKDRLIDNKKYFKFIWPQSYFWTQEAQKFDTKKLIVLINANKRSPLPKELYSERVKIIRYCEENNKEFDLYGWWWNKPNLKQEILWFQPFLSYKWRAENKIKTIANYKFNICFENMRDTPWYMTEKIRDSFKAKTVPIYRWASNISDCVPENCFIDYRKYIWEDDKLFHFIETMNERVYNTYIDNIKIFLESDDARKRFDNKRAKDFIKQL